MRRNSKRMKSTVCLMLAATMLLPAETSGDLRVMVVSGDGAVNNVRRKVTNPIEVEIRDERNRPVEGARVRFTLPTLGPGGRFADGSRSTEVMTDARGRAGFTSFTPNEQEGRFTVVVDAISKGREASSSVSQTNSRYLMQAPSRGLEMTGTGRRGGRTLAIVLGVGAAAAVGGVVAIRGGGGRGPTAATAAPVGISVGGVSVGGPQ